MSQSSVVTNCHREKLSSATPFLRGDKMSFTNIFVVINCRLRIFCRDKLSCWEIVAWQIVAWQNVAWQIVGESRLIDWLISQQNVSEKTYLQLLFLWSGHWLKLNCADSRNRIHCYIPLFTDFLEREITTVQNVCISAIFSNHMWQGTEHHWRQNSVSIFMVLLGAKNCQIWRVT